MKQNNFYPPKMRSFYKPENFKVKSFSKKDSNPFIESQQNHIVTNNIAYSEFDYTEDPLDPATYED